MALSKKNLLRLALLAIAVLIFVLGSTVFDVGQLFRDTRSQFESLGWVGPILFALIYGALGALAAPTGLVELIAGALFGFWIGGAAVIAGALLAANIGFACGRWLARDWVSKKLEGKRLARQIEAAVEQRGFWITVLIRLSPVVPFNLTSYVLGASTIRWSTFLAASVLGMLPIKLFLIWLGASGQKLIGAAKPSQWGSNEWLLYGGGLVATIIVVVLIGWTVARTSNRVLREAEETRDR
ncbi:TVP38/TMEM64 family protein [Salinisphaera aquimarina]|uniref:TVP38/TMEM64 family membrane protein n=1 Tax=Salinisphaera aquimarina TaxID=2094031 RepID=A0ABV7EQS4_9GAMM